MSIKSERKKVLKKYVKKNGLKFAGRRSVVFDEFFKIPCRHVSIEELYKRVKKVYPPIGYATVYRTLKLFKDSGIAFERNFADGKNRYEPVRFEGEHHDHLICMSCGAIKEFKNEQMEHYVTEVAKQMDFEITRHKVEIYGYCLSCKKIKVGVGKE